MRRMREAADEDAEDAAADFTEAFGFAEGFDVATRRGLW